MKENIEALTEHENETELDTQELDAIAGGGFVGPQDNPELGSTIRN